LSSSLSSEGFIPFGKGSWVLSFELELSRTCFQGPFRRFALIGNEVAKPRRTLSRNPLRPSSGFHTVWKRPPSWVISFELELSFSNSNCPFQTRCLEHASRTDVFFESERGPDRGAGRPWTLFDRFRKRMTDVFFESERGPDDGAEHATTNVFFEFERGHGYFFLYFFFKTPNRQKGSSCQIITRSKNTNVAADRPPDRTARTRRDLHRQRARSLCVPSELQDCPSDLQPSECRRRLARDAPAADRAGAGALGHRARRGHARRRRRARCARARTRARRQRGSVRLRHHAVDVERPGSFFFFFFYFYFRFRGSFSKTATTTTTTTTEGRRGIVVPLAIPRDSSQPRDARRLGHHRPDPRGHAEERRRDQGAPGPPRHRPEPGDEK